MDCSKCMTTFVDKWGDRMSKDEDGKWSSIQGNECEEPTDCEWCRKLEAEQAGAASLRDALESVEWAIEQHHQEGTDYLCPSCRCTNELGHDDDCKLQQALSIPAGAEFLKKHRELEANCVALRGALENIREAYHDVMNDKGSPHDWIDTLDYALEVLDTPAGAAMLERVKAADSVAEAASRVNSWLMIAEKKEGFKIPDELQNRMEDVEVAIAVFDGEALDKEASAK